MTRFAFVFNEDLPEVTTTDNPVLVKVGGSPYCIDGFWNAERFRTDALNFLAVAEYLDSLKPKLPTEPGSVILATKIKDWEIGKDGVYLVLPHGRHWASLDGLNIDIPRLDIEDWKPVQLNVVEVSS